MRTFILLIAIIISVSCGKPNIVITPLNTHSNISIRAISVVNDSTIWASGTNSTVLKSTSYGEKWESIVITDTVKLDFRSLHAWDENNALVISIDNPALIYKTADGGKTWKNVFKKSLQGIFINSVNFRDSQHGIAVGDQIDGKFYILHTTDGGENWKEIEGPKGERGEGGFAASNSCIQYLPSGKIIFITGMTKSNAYSTTDKDFVWEKSETGITLASPDGTGGAYCIYMNSDNNGIVAGGDYKSVTQNTDIVATTNNGGKTWTLPNKTNNTPSTKPHGFISCVRPLTQEILFATGSHGSSVSYDMGKTWETLNQSSGYHALGNLKGRKLIYAAGEKGRIARIELK